MTSIAKMSKGQNKGNLIHKSFKEPIFSAKVVLLSNCSAQEAGEFLEKRFRFDRGAMNFLHGCDGVTFDVSDRKSNGDVYISFAIWVEKPEDYSVVAHECLHLAGKILDTRGVPVSKKNDEVLAYYQGYWIEKFWKFLSRYAEKEKNTKSKARKKLG